MTKAETGIQLEKLAENAYYLVSGEQYSLHKGMNTLAFSYIFKNKIDVEILKKAFNIEIQRNDALCERYVDDKDDKEYPVKAYFVEPYEIDFEYADFTGMTEEKQKKAVKKIMRKPIERRNAPFGRITIVKMRDGKDGFLTTLNHYNLDALGAIITLNDVMKVYEALRDGTEMPKELASWREEKKALSEKYTPEAIAQTGELFRNNVQEHLKNGPYKATSCFDFKRSTNKKLIKRNNKVVPKGIKELGSVLRDKGGYDSYILDAEYVQKARDFCTANQISFNDYWHMVVRSYDLWHNDRDETSFYVLFLNARTGKLRRTGGCVFTTSECRVDATNDSTIRETLWAIHKEMNTIYRVAACPDWPNTMYLNTITKTSIFSKSGYTYLSVIDVPVETSEELSGEFDYLDSGYSVLPMYHIMLAGSDGKMKMIFIYQKTHYV